MKQEIINKLNLTISNTIIGESDKNNIPIYELGDNVLLANCEKNGRKNEFMVGVVRVFFKNPKLTFLVSEHLLLDDIRQFYSKIEHVIKVHNNMTYE